MKYTCAVEIYQSLASVIVLFNNPDNLPDWMPDLVSVELVSGDPSDVGAVSRMSFKTNTLEYEIVETITKKRLPVQFARTYKMQGVTQEVSDSFSNTGDHQTTFTSKNEISFSGIMLLIGWATKWFFKKRTQKQMSHFKHYAENYVPLT